jgi:hypothetical protein
MAGELQFFDCLTADIAAGKHNFHADTFKVMLSAAEPNAASDETAADVAEIGATGGYQLGGNEMPVSRSNANGVESIFCADVSFVASGAGFGPFRYVVLYNATHPEGPLIGYWNYGSQIALSDGELFRLKMGQRAELFSIGRA